MVVGMESQHGSLGGYTTGRANQRHASPFQSVRTLAEQPQRVQILHDVASLVGDQQQVQLVHGVVHIPGRMDAHQSPTGQAQRVNNYTTDQAAQGADGWPLHFTVRLRANGSDKRANTVSEGDGEAGRRASHHPRHTQTTHRQLSVSTNVCCLVPVPTNLGNAATRPCCIGRKKQ